ncbi:hypothetical protein JB92DRAFT_3062714 [Gautieria morchelliformis]|nr:hypothetical protein JB92DRAFT_3062714 [Gautieria morchelliformis]
MSPVPRFIVNYHFDPRPMLHMDWMSKEDSEPEGILLCETEADHQVKRDEWRTEMLQRQGFMGNSDAHDDIGILEVIEPKWRILIVSAR